MQQKLISRIRKGRAWLHVNSQSYCEEHGKEYDPTKYEYSLKKYEEMVDECDTPEKECWEYPEGTTAGDMEDFEIEFTLNPPQVDKQIEM